MPQITITCIFDIPVPSAAPTGIVGSAQDARTLQVSWAPPPAESQNGVINEYAVRISAQETAEQFLHTTTGGTFSLVIGELHPDYTYTYTVAAATAVGRGPFSVFGTVKMPEDGKHFYQFLKLQVNDHIY